MTIPEAEDPWTDPDWRPEMAPPMTDSFYRAIGDWCAAENAKGRPGTGGGVMSFPEDSWVEARYPLTGKQEHGDRDAWPWLPGWVVSQCGPDEWEICVQTPELAMEHEGETVFPVCFRDSSELRSPAAEPEAGP